MSKKYIKVKGYYNKGFWSLRQVGDAVKKCWVTAEEFKEITGEDYQEANA